MSSVPESLRNQLKAHLTPGSRWCVALSGGLDSSVLLHALCELRTEFNDIDVRAIHIDHGLHPRSPEWAEICQDFCEKLGVPLYSAVVHVERSGGDGLENAARSARYKLFSSILAEDEYLLTAHHEEDQVETILLRLLRGSGTVGLGGIADRRRLGPGWILRPLLGTSRACLEAYARAAAIIWVEDPSNVDTALDRNYLRHEVLPRLRERWPGFARPVSRAGRLARESAQLLDELAEIDGRELLVGDTVAVAAMARLDPPRQRNFIRHLLRSRGLAAPSEAQLKSGIEQLLSARDDRQPILRWPHGQIRRYRGRLYVLEFDPDTARESLPATYEWNGREPLEMGFVRGRLRLEANTTGIDERWLSEGLTVRYRLGGERIRRIDQPHHQSLKKLFQAGGILPWMRPHVPLLYGRGKLVAVGDLWLAAEARGESGYRVVWENHPAIE